jgi:hypothetical protein
LNAEIDKLELLNALGGLAEAVRKFFMGLRDEGFTEEQAMRFTLAWLQAVSNQRTEE